MTFTESNRFSLCGNEVQLLRFHASAGTYASERTTKGVSFRVVRGRLVSARSIMIDAREPRKTSSRPELKAAPIKTAMEIT